jgi:5'-AMP-activated protein kinase regulatory gamma subunit
MVNHGTSGLPVVDASRGGRIVGTFSSSDLRTLSSEHLGALGLPTAEFLALEHGTEYWGVAHDEGAAPPAAEAGRAFAAERRRSHAERLAHGRPGHEVGQATPCISPNDTVAAALGVLVARKVHRVWVLDQYERPVGVVTMTDVLKLVYDGKVYSARA